MQMGRWFGYRSGYEDLCKIYMPSDRIRDFADIITATEELMADFKLMSENNRTPDDFGLAVRENPDSALQVTAKNKQRNVREFTHSMRLDGKAKETSTLSSDINEIDKNIEVIKSFVLNLPAQPTIVQDNLLWKNIDKGFVQEFLKNFKTFSADPLGLTARMPITFIKKYAEEKLTNWDVALYSGQGGKFPISAQLTIKKEKRKMIIKDNGNYELQNRQVSSGNSESITFDEAKRKEIGGDRSRARAELERPLLMLHILEPSFDPSKESPTEIAAFGISFPGTVLSETETVRLKINTVFYKNLLEELEEENQSDD